MPAGRPPKSIQLDRIDGTLRPDRHDRRVEPEAPGLLQEARPPAWTTKRERRIRREVFADAPDGLLRRIDRQLPVNYVELVARLETVAIAPRKLDKLATSPLLSGGSDHEVISPHVRIMNHCVMLMAKLQSEMGCLCLACVCARRLFAEARISRDRRGANASRRADEMSQSN